MYILESVASLVRKLWIFLLFFGIKTMARVLNSVVSSLFKLSISISINLCHYISSCMDQTSVSLCVALLTTPSSNS